MKRIARLLPLFASLFIALTAQTLSAQDWVHTGTNLGADRIRIAAADFKPASGDPRNSLLSWVS